MVQNELTHYGVLGMKWGVRRTDAQLGKSRVSGLVSTQKRKLPMGTMSEEQPKHKKPIGVKYFTKETDTPARINTKKKLPNDTHDDYKKAHSSKSVNSMSNQELRETNNRLQMEQQYSQLNRKHTSAGKKFVTGVLIAAGTSVATKYATQYMTKGVEAVIEAVKNRPLPNLYG